LLNCAIPSTKRWVRFGNRDNEDFQKEAEAVKSETHLYVADGQVTLAVLEIISLLQKTRLEPAKKKLKESFHRTIWKWKSKG
jgi:hypothetical protein